MTDDIPLVPLEEDVTIIITTSPAACHPSTELLLMVLESFDLSPGLAHCRTLLICDGVRFKDKCNFRGGFVTEERYEKYLGYVAGLRDHCSQGHPAFKNIQVVQLDQHFGFGLAVREALRLVETKFVVVVQHDRCFTRMIDFAPILQCMKRHADQVGYVLLPTSSTDNYAHAVRSKLGHNGIKGENAIVGEHALHIHDAGHRDAGADTQCERTQPSEAPPDYTSIIQAGGVDGWKRTGPRTLIPCIQWYDSTHVASTEWYREAVFGAGCVVRRGGFIEDSFGAKQWADFKVRGLAARADWKCWLYEDGGGRAVGHLNGRTFGTTWSLRGGGVRAGRKARTGEGDTAEERAGAEAAEGADAPAAPQ